MKSLNLSGSLIIVYLLFFYPLQTAAQPYNASADTTTVSIKPEIFVRWTDQKIRIDGILNEAAWNDADPYEAFFYQHQPLDRAPSSEKTRVMVLQDANVIYFGVQCYDSEPDKIFASTMRRDRNYGSGDVLELLLDTFQDNRNCYAFDTNPLGGKGDALIRDQGNHINKQWECVIYMDGAINARGWAAEFAIPFKSLQYKEGEIVDWNINISREIKHRQEETYLVPIPRELGHMAKFRGELFGTLRNIQPPRHGLNVEVYPYMLTGQTNIYGDQKEKKDEFHSGVDLKYDITPQLALDLTYQTDFAQAEAEEKIVNVTRFNIQRREKREIPLSGTITFSQGDELSVEAVRAYEFVPNDAYIRDIKIDAGIYSTWVQSVTFNSYRARPVNSTLDIIWGELFDGSQIAVNMEGTAKASNHLSVDVTYTYNKLDLKNGHLQAHVLSSRWTWSFTPDFFAKAYLQWNTADERFSGNFILDYAYRPRSHIYLVYNENQDTFQRQPTDRIIMLKLTYLWQI